MNNESKSGTVSGMFDDRARAEDAYRTLVERGYARDEVWVLMSERTRRRLFPEDEDNVTELGSKAGQGAGIGATIGGALGAVVAGVAAIGSNLIMPGLGLVVAGPLAAALAGAGAGGLAGGLVGALIGVGIPEERVRHYEEHIRGGGILIGVTARSDDDAEYIERRWRERGQHVLGASFGVGGGVAGTVDPEAESAYWRDSYRDAPDYQPDYGYEDYGPAYTVGYQGRGRLRGSFEGAEQILQDEWERIKGKSRLTWDQARAAARAAWERVEGLGRAMGGGAHGGGDGRDEAGQDRREEGDRRREERERTGGETRE